MGDVVLIIERIKENYNFTDWDASLPIKLAPIMKDKDDNFVEQFYKKAMQFKND